MDYCVLVVNGAIKDFTYYKNILENAKLIVCSDGGANLIYKNKLDIDFIIGDLDSIEDEVLNYYKSKNVIIKKYPARKNKTDSELSIDIIKEQGIKKIIMIGALGNRVDHFLANINLLYYADKLGINLTILDENNEISLLNKKDNYIEVKIGQTVSFVSICGDVKGISLKGFEYELSNYDLSQDSSLLTSNIARKQRPYIQIQKGSLVCIKVNE